MLAWPPAGVIDGVPKVGIFPAGELHENPVGCRLNMMNFGVMADRVKSDRSTRWTRRRRCGSKSTDGVHQGRRK